MTEPQPNPEAMSKLAAGLSAFTLIADSTVGYRKTLVDGGISPEVADQMAEQYHTTLLEITKTQLAAQAISNIKSPTGGKYGRR